MKLFSLRLLAALSICLLPAAASADNHGWHGGGRGFYGHGYGGRGYYWHGGYYGRRWWGPGYYGWGWGPYIYGPSIGFDYYDGPSPYYNDGPVYRGVPAGGGGADSLFFDVQRVLRHGGYYKGSVDGVPGPGTQAAIRAYQVDHRLPVTGRVDGRLIISMHLN